MAKRVTLTNQGLSLLASSSEATGQYYWLGYYALAYVPNLWKNDTVSIPDECDSVNSDSLGSELITETDTDQISSTMTRLTKYGDMIYNIWQGDLNGTGYMGYTSDGSAGGDLFALTLYNTSVKKHYRYVLDENGNNTLVGWITDPSYTDGTMLGKHVYKGTDGYYSSTLPIPAPVYYLGDVSGKVSVDGFFDDLPTFENTSTNGANLYPFVTVTLSSDETLDIPRVSADYRGYTDSQGNPGTFNYGGTGDFETPITDPGLYFNSTEIPYPLDPDNLQFNETSWFAANQTFNVSESSTDVSSIFGEEFWKLHTISNYNLYHAPVDSIGNVLDSDLSNRNMAKTTKFFPISNYKVINSESGFTSSSEVVEVATAIKLTIDVDITPKTLTQGFDDDYQIDEESNIEFFDNYGKAIHPSDAIDEFGNNIYESTHTSFKFNRIGIYAVPLRKAPYVQDQGFGTVSDGENVELEFQINPDDEPTLFAVIDWDNTIAMSDTGDGINQFSAEVDVNLESPLGTDDTALLRNTTIFYNMYEDDALRWYQNQLISTASTSNAITEIGLEVAHIKNINSESKCCPVPDLSNKYAPLNHSHDFTGNSDDVDYITSNYISGTDTEQWVVVADSMSEGDIYKIDIYMHSASGTPENNKLSYKLSVLDEQLQIGVSADRTSNTDGNSGRVGTSSDVFTDLGLNVIIHGTTNNYRMFIVLDADSDLDIYVNIDTWNDKNISIVEVISDPGYQGTPIYKLDTNTIESGEEPTIHYSENRTTEMVDSMHVERSLRVKDLIREKPDYGPTYPILTTDSSGGVIPYARYLSSRYVDYTVSLSSYFTFTGDPHDDLYVRQDALGNIHLHGIFYPANFNISDGTILCTITDPNLNHDTSTGDSIVVDYTTLFDYYPIYFTPYIDKLPGSCRVVLKIAPRAAPNTGWDISVIGDIQTTNTDGFGNDASVMDWKIELNGIVLSGV